MGAKIHEISAGIWLFYCPGCKYDHPFHVLPQTPPRPIWSWNGSTEKPTFSPSLMVFGSVPEQRCHSFVTDGRIQFLSDCHHALAGQTVDLPDYGEDT